MKPKFNRRPRQKNGKTRTPVQEAPARLRQPSEDSNGHLQIDTVDDGIAFDVHVVPRSAQSRVAGTHGNRLHVKVNAPPIEGAANQAVCHTIAKALGVSASQVSIIRGVASRLKRVHVAGLSEPQARKSFAS